MIEIALEGLAKHLDEGTIQVWFVEEGDPVAEGDDLVEIQTEDGTFTITSAVSGVLAEVYYDEGEIAGRGEILCTIDDESGDEDDADEDEEDEEDEDEEDDKKKSGDDDEDLDEEDEEEDEE
jgi:pyruvate dehydrogenase E2 component (dihydrolipoamide acetyltransferase)